MFLIEMYKVYVCKGKTKKIIRNRNVSLYRSTEGIFIGIRIVKCIIQVSIIIKKWNILVY